MTALRIAFLSLHTLGGLVGLALGIYALRPPDPWTFRLWLRRAYGLSIGVLTVFLIATVVLDWANIDTTQRIVFGVLVALAIVMLGRVLLAQWLARRRPDRWRSRYQSHIYFTYISLWEGFLIVGLIDLGMPGWLVGVAAVALVIVGTTWFNRWKQTNKMSPTAAG